ncbi:hypothetical protein MMC24_003004 [Lignoscripta atroalba]|nr:hypothetical protein [Lignoscripta atroalba]
MDSGEVLGVSREPDHNYKDGPPSPWIADSRQQGLVYGSATDRLIPTNAKFLRTCRRINEEATPVFYGANKIVLYAEDNNDIFYWLLDIGEQNRRSIRSLSLSWAYGVQIEAGRGNIHDILSRVADMEDSCEEEIQMHRDQLIDVIRHLETKTVRLIIRTLNLLVSNQDLVSLAVYLPGIDGGDMWDLPNDNVYFAEEIFSNSTTNVHGCIPEALRKMAGIKSLTIGYTKDVELAEEIAKCAGAEELIIRVRPEADSLGLNDEEQAKWLENGWHLEGATARKQVARDKTLKRPRQAQSSSEDGRLKSEMIM